jgi:hypothetical protein
MFFGKLAVVHVLETSAAVLSLDRSLTDINTTPKGSTTMSIFCEEAALEAVARVCLVAFVGFATGLLSPESAARGPRPNACRHCGSATGANASQREYGSNVSMDHDHVA